jgi:hypothetical protein
MADRDWLELVDGDAGEGYEASGAESPVQTLPGMDGEADALTEAQLRSRKARRVFEAQHDAGPWMDDYWDLLEEGWSWRQAVFMLWAAQPADQRRPRYQHELATEVLGLTSDRVISQWKAENPAMQTRIKALTASALAKARSEIYAALIESASDPNPRSHSDRKLALEMLGDYVKRQEVGVVAGEVADWSEVSEEDLASIAQLPDGADD